MTTLLNPFSLSLKKPPFMEVHSEPVYTKGDFRIYVYCGKHYVHTFKNIVIAERGAKNIDLLNNVQKDIKPKGEAALYHDYERPKAAMLDGIKAAKKLKFTIQ